MRTVIHRSLILFVTACTIGLTQAAEPVRMKSANKRTSLERTLHRALNNHLAYPLLSKEDMNGDVHVSFVIDKEGRIQVVDASSANEPLKAYVLRKLAHIDIGDNPDGSWKTTHMVFHFHPEGA